MKTFTNHIILLAVFFVMVCQQMSGQKRDEAWIYGAVLNRLTGETLVGVNATPVSYTHLRSSLKIKERDFYMCVLVRLAFSAHQIQVLLRSSASTVSMARMRLLKKIFATEGGAEEFDRRLRD